MDPGLQEAPDLAAAASGPALAAAVGAEAGHVLPRLSRPADILRLMPEQAVAPAEALRHFARVAKGGIP